MIWNACNWIEVDLPPLTLLVRLRSHSFPLATRFDILASTTPALLPPPFSFKSNESQSIRRFLLCGCIWFTSIVDPCITIRAFWIRSKGGKWIEKRIEKFSVNWICCLMVLGKKIVRDSFWIRDECGIYVFDSWLATTWVNVPVIR